MINQWNKKNYSKKSGIFTIKQTYTVAEQSWKSYHSRHHLVIYVYCFLPWNAEAHSDVGALQRMAIDSELGRLCLVCCCILHDAKAKRLPILHAELQKQRSLISRVLHNAKAKGLHNLHTQIQYSGH